MSQQPPYPDPYGQQPPPPGQQPPYPGQPPAPPPAYPGQYGQQPDSQGQGQGQPVYPAQYGQGQYAQGQYAQYGQYDQYAQQGYSSYGQYPAYPQSGGRQRTDSTTRIIGWGIVATAVIVAVAAFLTWIDFPGGDFDINGVTGNDNVPGEDEAQDGVITLFLAILVAGFAIVRALGPLSLTAAIIGTVGGLLVTLIAIIDIADFQEEKDKLGGAVDVSIGLGLWLTLAAGILMAAISTWGIVKRR